MIHYCPLVIITITIFHKRPPISTTTRIVLFAIFVPDLTSRLASSECTVSYNLSELGFVGLPILASLAEAFIKICTDDALI